MESGVQGLFRDRWDRGALAERGTRQVGPHAERRQKLSHRGRCGPMRPQHQAVLTFSKHKGCVGAGGILLSHTRTLNGDLGRGGTCTAALLAVAARLDAGVRPDLCPLSVTSRPPIPTLALSLPLQSGMLSCFSHTGEERKPHVSRAHPRAWVQPLTQPSPRRVCG